MRDSTLLSVAFDIVIKYFHLQGNMVHPVSQSTKCPTLEVDLMNFHCYYKSIYHPHSKACVVFQM